MHTNTIYLLSIRYYKYFPLKVKMYNLFSLRSSSLIYTYFRLCLLGLWYICVRARWCEQTHKMHKYCVDSNVNIIEWNEQRDLSVSMFTNTTTVITIVISRKKSSTRLRCQTIYVSWFSFMDRCRWHLIYVQHSRCNGSRISFHGVFVCVGRSGVIDPFCRTNIVI